MEVANGGNTQYGMEKLVGNNNYKYWRMCMEAYLQGQDLWELVTEIDADDKISEARLRRYLVSGLRKEYGPFVTSIQGWSQQPSVEEGSQIRRIHHWNKTKEEDSSAEKGGNSQSKKSITCFRCGKTGHIKRNCRVKISKANVACASEGDDQLKWEQCFAVEVEEKSFQTLVNYVKNDKEEWIIDSGCSHHVTGKDTLFSEMRQHHGERVIVTVDNSTYPVAKEGVVTIDVADDTRTSSVKLNDVYHVPGLKKNLVSVSQITDSGKYVLFGPNDVKVLDNVKDISADVILTREESFSVCFVSR
ncbi:hypothetical protein Pint_25392 [Pistacia integerrima]|uniref:Uncharacterized protein n=1 Tax=Pistacia integerrima TaxID=434235 RepID=A0ACC0YGG2_9ROSI|nr:hypothetical protein Pint_25392 [Pistacia integerrima]